MSLTKNVERKKNRRISRRRLVRNPTVQNIIINLHTKYEYSSLHSFTEIFDENFVIQSMERKKIGQIQGRIRGEGWFAIPRYSISLSTCLPNMTILACTVSQKSLTKNFILQSMERKKIGQIQGRIRRNRWFAIPQYNTSLSICIPNMTTLASGVIKFFSQPLVQDKWPVKIHLS